MERNRILIVEDEFIVARNLQKRLMNLGFSVPALAATAEQAIHEAERTNPDLVLMDIRLEGEGDGIAAARYIHERLGIPVVYLTAYADADTIRRAKVAEPLGFLPKPFGLRELQTTIEVALYKHSIDAHLRRNERWLDATLRCIGEAVIAVDPQGAVAFLNPAAEALVGVPRERAAGRPLAEILSLSPLTPDPRAPDAPAVALREGRLLDLVGDVVVRPAHGREAPVALSATPLVDERGRDAGVLLVLQDLLRDGERRCRELEADLQAAHERIATLRRLLPTCPSCGRVRDAHGAWHDLGVLPGDGPAPADGALCPECQQHQRAAPPQGD